MSTTKNTLDTNIELFGRKERIPRIQIMNNLNTNNEYPGCKYRFPWIQIMILSIVACCVCVAEQIQGKHTISLCSNLWESGLSARVFYQTIFKDFFILRTVLSPASRMSTWKCETALFVLTAHQLLIPQSFSLSPLNCFAKKQKQEKKIHQFIFFIAGEWSYSTLTFRVATVLIIASSALVSVRYFRFAPSADTWKLFIIKN